jgi:acyl-[acyl-carrier-protein]-phospholipid O-acyltransferase/long-chain-fatty-acid--[acyl-carrier-protein] ligase
MAEATSRTWDGRDRDGIRSTRGFWSLIVTQFLGAFNDNALRGLITFLAMAMLSTKAVEWGVPLVGAAFSIPFILFSLMGGYLADRYSKRSVAIGTKVLEVAIMAFALVGLSLSHLPSLYVAVFLMGTQSALFGPTKYGLLPELLPSHRLSWGNGIIEMGTMLAIIAGTASAGLLSQGLHGQPAVIGAILLGVALAGLGTSLAVDRVPAADPRRRLEVNYVRELGVQWKQVRPDRVLFLAIAGNTYFWFLAMLLQTHLVLHAHQHLGLGDATTSGLLAALAIGIGLGSVAAGQLSGQKIEMGLVPVGAAGLTVFTGVLAWPGLSLAGLVAALAMLGFSGGFFAVPINALIQHRPSDRHRGGVIAFANLLAFSGTFLASGAALLAARAQITPRQVFFLAALTTLIGAVYVLALLPQALLRLALWAMTHSLYRLRVKGGVNVPDKGGALLVCNHLSYADVAFVQASTARPIRFVMHKDFYDLWWLRPIARLTGAIPVSSSMRPRAMIEALRSAGDAVRQGDVVCIFAEGQISRIGQLLPFARGLERIMRGVEAPIVPVCLDGVWGSIFSFSRRRFLWKRPERLLEPVTVSYGRPLPADSKAPAVREAVQALMTDAWLRRRPRTQTLERTFVRSARRHPFRLAMVDDRSGALRYGGALTKTVFLARRLRSHWAGQERVGILLPPSVGGALVNQAALLLGKIPVNLNYTTSSDVMAACATRARVKSVVTSRAFLEKLRQRFEVTVPGTTVFLEDTVASPKATEKLAAMALAWLTPARWLPRLLGCRRRVGPDDIATIIFSSGSTGAPKGVVLTHFNIASNVAQVAQTFALHRRDRIVGILPFVHSFGFTATLALPAALGVGVVFHANPLEARTIGEMVSRYRATFLLATPTFLQTYLRRCPPGAFGSLELVMAGAEKLPERIATAFEERFGVRPLEGYGCTECSPVVCVNTRDFRAAGLRQVGAKRGTIGHPLPGVSVRIANPETLETVPAGEEGVLLVRGPNVMQGYLEMPEKTAEVLRGGWYVTGDVASLDRDGFLQITDRLNRFSKIGGEMVPHLRVEEGLHELAGLSERAFVVTGVVDDRKGERLTVFHTLDDTRLGACLERLKHAGWPSLWSPRPRDFHRVDAIPILGTGKLDLARVRELAAAL